MLPAAVERALGGLPIPRRMRWGAGDAEFVRPVHWVVMLHGNDVIDATIMGFAPGTRRAAIASIRPARSSSRKRMTISRFLKTTVTLLLTLSAGEAWFATACARSRPRRAVKLSTASLCTTRWRRWSSGRCRYWRFDEQYLSLPREVVISTLTGHQRYFPVADEDGRLLPRFITVANIESKDPDQVRDGNERVIRPRLADAAFFWDYDRRNTLASRQEALREVVYQRGLGSLHDKSRRIAALAKWAATALGVDGSTAERAAALAKCDLLTGMVGEFPELQGTMGRYYALSDGEPEAVASAIGEHYRPRFAGDALPATVAGQILSVADKLDTLAGVFAIGKKPTGNRDPFGLRRAALGIVRIFIECRLDLDLKALIGEPLAHNPREREKAEVCDALYTYITDRLRRYFLDRDTALATETFDAVLARSPSSLVDFGRRLDAVQAFIKLDAAAQPRRGKQAHRQHSSQGRRPARAEGQQKAVRIRCRDPAGQRARQCPRQGSADARLTQLRRGFEYSGRSPRTGRPVLR